MPSSQWSRGLALLCLLIWCRGSSLCAAELRVMSFNLWHGGHAGKQPLPQTVEVIRAAKADIVGLQETHGFSTNGVTPDSGRRIAEILGWHYFDQGGHTGIASRFPILTNTPRKYGAMVRLPSGRKVRMFNAHLMHAPYQPYQLLKIPYADAPFIKTADEAVRAAREARGEQIERLLSDLKPALASGEAVFLSGDFNEPSHQDWTQRAAYAGKCPLPVPFPSTRAVEDAGLRDAFRTMFPDEVQETGWTWTPTTDPTDPKDRHDRIDFVFFAGNGVKLTKCEIVGEDSRFADILVTPYPSDHRAVVATLTVP
jgi:endonuclease/exonuclease/phosphatase family metal-dependent hydrolase